MSMLSKNCLNIKLNEDKQIKEGENINNKELFIDSNLDSNCLNSEIKDDDKIVLSKIKDDDKIVLSKIEDDDKIVLSKTKDDDKIVLSKIEDLFEDDEQIERKVLTNVNKFLLIDFLCEKFSEKDPKFLICEFDKKYASQQLLLNSNYTPKCNIYGSKISDVNISSSGSNNNSSGFKPLNFIKKKAFNNNTTNNNNNNNTTNNNNNTNVFNKSQYSNIQFDKSHMDYGKSNVNVAGAGGMYGNGSTILLNGVQANSISRIDSNKVDTDVIKVKSAFNKVTNTTIEKFGAEIISCKIETVIEMKELAGFFFKKAISEPSFIEVYSKLLSILKRSFRSVEEIKMFNDKNNSNAAIPDDKPEPPTCFFGTILFLMKKKIESEQKWNNTSEIGEIVKLNKSQGKIESEIENINLKRKILKRDALGAVDFCMCLYNNSVFGVRNIQLFIEHLKTFPYSITKNTTKELNNSGEKIEMLTRIIVKGKFTLKKKKKSLYEDVLSFIIANDIHGARISVIIDDAVNESKKTDINLSNSNLLLTNNYSQQMVVVSRINTNGNNSNSNFYGNSNSNSFGNSNFYGNSPSSSPSSSPSGGVNFPNSISQISQKNRNKNILSPNTISHVKNEFTGIRMQSVNNVPSPILLKETEIKNYLEDFVGIFKNCHDMEDYEEISETILARFEKCYKDYSKLFWKEFLLITITNLKLCEKLITCFCSFFLTQKSVTTNLVAILKEIKEQMEMLVKDDYFASKNFQILLINLIEFDSKGLFTKSLFDELKDEKFIELTKDYLKDKLKDKSKNSSQNDVNSNSSSSNNNNKESVTEPENVINNTVGFDTSAFGSFDIDPSLFSGFNSSTISSLINDNGLNSSAVNNSINNKPSKPFEEAIKIYLTEDEIKKITN